MYKLYKVISPVVKKLFGTDLVNQREADSTDADEYFQYFASLMKSLGHGHGKSMSSFIGNFPAFQLLKHEFI